MAAPSKRSSPPDSSTSVQPFPQSIFIAEESGVEPAPAPPAPEHRTSIVVPRRTATTESTATAPPEDHQRIENIVRDRVEVSTAPRSTGPVSRSLRPDVSGEEPDLARFLTEENVAPIEVAEVFEVPVRIAEDLLLGSPRLVYTKLPGGQQSTRKTAPQSERGGKPEDRRVPDVSRHGLADYLERRAVSATEVADTFEVSLRTAEDLVDRYRRSIRNRGPDSTIPNRPPGS